MGWSHKAWSTQSVTEWLLLAAECLLTSGCKCLLLRHCCWAESGQAVLLDIGFVGGSAGMLAQCVAANGFEDENTATGQAAAVAPQQIGGRVCFRPRMLLEPICVVTFLPLSQPYCCCRLVATSLALAVLSVSVAALTRLAAGSRLLKPRGSVPTGMVPVDAVPVDAVPLGVVPLDVPVGAVPVTVAVGSSGSTN